MIEYREALQRVMDQLIEAGHTDGTETSRLADRILSALGITNS